MKIMMQIAIIFLLCFVGELIAAILPFPFPASVISMILVFCFLLWGPLKVYHIKKQTVFCMIYGIFLYPAGSFDYRKSALHGGQAADSDLYLRGIYFTTFAITAWTVTAMIKLEAKRKERKHHASA